MMEHGASRPAWVAGLWLGAAVVVGCTVKNPNYCPGAPEMNCHNVDAGPDATIPCADGDDCAGSAATVCKLPEGVCVECLDRTTCTTATEPVCDPTTSSCVGCRAHADCAASSACLPDGSCADAVQVAYVSPVGTGTACTLGAPCRTLADALAKHLPVVKIMGPGIVDDDRLTIIDRKVTIVADPTALLDRTTDGTILEVRTSNADVKISDLQISGAGGSDGNAIDVTSGSPKLTVERVAIYSNNGVGIKANAGRVTIRRSMFSVNYGGGATITSADFDITNSLFVANGGVQSNFGGVELGPITTNYSFQFNTIATNHSKLGTDSQTGINCTAPVNLSNNIVNGNKTSTNCVFDFTLFDAGTVVNGHNLTGDPAFRNVDTATPTSPTYYRIGPASAALDRADPAAAETIDIDGDPRPQGGGNDMGADEFKP